jgi:hypothetical protein
VGRLPDFVIVGFPKCGTQAVLRILGQHPDIHTHPDEARFFGRRRVGLPEYMSLFDSDAQVVGEKSAGYILFDESMEDLATTIPEARIVVCLRHPVHMLHSFYNFRVFEHERGFRGGFDPAAHTFHRMMLEDVRIGSFGAYAADHAVHITDKLLPRFPRDQCHFVIQERLWRDPEREFEVIHDFLGVDPVPTEPVVINSRVAGGDRYPHVDYGHPEYPDALRALLDRSRAGRRRLLDVVGGEIPEWDRYDAMYEAWAGA